MQQISAFLQTISRPVFGIERVILGPDLFRKLLMDGVLNFATSQVFGIEVECDDSLALNTMLVVYKKDVE